MAEIVKEYSNGSAIKIVYSYTQSVAKNQSTVTMTLYVHRDSYGPSWNTHCNSYMQLDGADVMTYDSSFTISTSWVKIGSTVSKTVNHNADGKKSITLKGFFDSEGLTTKLTNLTVSDTVTLKTIPRASSFTLSDSSITAGNPMAVSITRASSSFTHTVKWTFGSHSKSTTGVETSASYTIPESWLDATPDSVSGTGTVTVITYNGSDEIGSTSGKFTVKAASDIVPSFTGIDFTRIDGDVPADWGIYVRTKSKVSAKIAGESGAYGSTIKGYSISGGGYSGTDSSLTTGFLNTAGVIAFTAQITDSRGRAAQKTDSIVVEDYSPPSLSAISGFRCGPDGVENDDGDYISLVALFSGSALDGRNPISGEYQYKAEGGDWSEFFPIASEEPAVFAATGDSTFTIRVKVSDAFTSFYQDIVVNSVEFIMDFKAGGTGVAFGKAAEVEDCTDMTGFEKTYLGPQSFLGGEGSALEKKLYFVTPDGVTYPHKVRFYGGNGESTTAVGLYDDAIGESSVGIIWNYNDVLRTLNVKVPLVSNGGISVFDTGITLDQCAYTQLVVKKKSGQNGDAIQFSDCDSGKTNWRVNAYRDVSGTDDSSLRFQADNAGDGSFSSNLILYPGGLVSATGDFEAGGNTTLKGNSTVNGWHYVKGQLRLDDEIRLYYNGASSLTGIIYQPNDYTINLGTYNGDDTLRYMQWLGEPDDLKRFVLRPSTNGGGYLGTTSMRWNTGFFTNTITQSDAKDKIHVRDLGQEALSFLSALRPVSFVFKDGEGGRTHLGLIAQEVASAAEDTGMGDLSLYQAVRLDEEGNEHPYSPQAPDEELRWGLNYQELIAPLIAAVQQLSRETQQLSREIEDLRDQLSALQQQKEENI